MEGESHPDEDKSGQDQQSRAKLHRPLALILEAEPQVTGGGRQQSDGGDRRQDPKQVDQPVEQAADAADIVRAFFRKNALVILI